MRVHWLQHAEHEGLGCIEPWLRSRKYAVGHTRLYAGEVLPTAGDFDWLIVMGGPMNIYEYERYPWLLPEKSLIRDACVNSKKVLGICLGGQLIADVLGGIVTRNKEAEIGWFEVRLEGEDVRSTVFSGFPSRFEAFHWHGDTFSIPPGCRNLMKSDACVNQAFQWGRTVAAMQFHLEVTHADAVRWLEQENLKPQRYVQSGAEILSQPARFARNNRLMEQVLERFDAP